MYKYLTADYHFNHRHIIKFCDRPFKDTEHMNNTLIRNTNEMCKKEDVLYHIGDFMFTKSKQADIIHTDPENELNPKVIHIEGNHDSNNGIKDAMDYAMINFANKNYLLVHIPPTSETFKYKNINLLSGIDCILCGHVHQYWKTKIYEGKYGYKIPIINVGVDAWNYRPVRFDKVNKLCKMLIKQNKII